jgi:beta-lactam-binding protein with PASTA domain
MELTYVTIVVLASMVFVLSGMVGYLYWQQTRMLQHLQSLALALATHVEQAHQQVVEDTAPQEEEQEEEEEDDRVSVAKEQVEVVQGPPATDVDVDDLQEKTSAQLRELLTKKGIPFGKRDSKTVLLELLKATA